MIFDADKIISPVEIIDRESHYVIIIHPASYKEVKELLDTKNIKHEDLKDKLVIYSFMGPKSSELLSRVLKIKENKIEDMLQEIGRFKNITFPNGAVIGITHQKGLTLPLKTLSKQVNLPTDFTNFIPEQPPIHLLKMLTK